jgi:CubicO group peptidase (beta-lactamase class C family)
MNRRTVCALIVAGSLGVLTAVSLGQVPGDPGDTTTTTTPTETTPPATTETTPAPPGETTPSPTPPGGPGGIVSEPAYDVDAFENGIVAALTGGANPAVGFGYAIAKDGKVVAQGGMGDARRPIDGQRDFTSSTRMEVMSVTKPVTAMALVRLLDVRGISYDAKVANYLPASWPRGKGFSKFSVKAVTFRHLLTHTSGLDQVFKALADTSQWSNDWDGLKWIVGNGTTPASYDYKNANLAMARVLIPQLWRKAGGPDSTVTAANHWKRTQTYINKYVLKPSGVPYARCWELDDATAALVYDVASPQAAGTLQELNGASREACAGHAGLHLSALDLAKVGTTLRSSSKIMSAAARTAMLSGRLGWDGGSNPASGPRVGHWYHGGDGDWGPRRVNTCLALMPQGYAAAVVINSDYSNAYQCTVLRNAYSLGKQ